jgi:hypothetical protein
VIVFLAEDPSASDKGAEQNFAVCHLPLVREDEEDEASYPNTQDYTSPYYPTLCTSFPQLDFSPHTGATQSLVQFHTCKYKLSVS